MKKWKTFGIISIIVSIGLMLTNFKWAKDFIFGFSLELFSLFNQHHSLNIVLTRQRNAMLTHWMLYIARYAIYGALFAMYVFRANPNVLIILFGIFAAKVLGILFELGRLKGGRGCVRG